MTATVGRATRQTVRDAVVVLIVLLLVLSVRVSRHAEAEGEDAPSRPSIAGLQAAEPLAASLDRALEPESATPVVAIPIRAIERATHFVIEIESAREAPPPPRTPKTAPRCQLLGRVGAAIRGSC
jgi:hypothetical protein